MKYRVSRFKSLKICLKELEPFIRNGQHLQTGKPFARFGGLRSREILANWLICVAVNFSSQTDRLTFSSDPLGGDGVIVDRKTGQTWPTEHVMVPSIRSSQAKDLETLILEKIELKWRRGATYASGKTLVVFLNAGGGPWFPNKVAKRLPAPLHFEGVWIVGLQCVEAGQYVYNVARLDPAEGSAAVWRVQIAKDFDDWTVEPIQ